MSRPALLTFPALDSRQAIDDALEALTARIVGWRELAPQIAAEVQQVAERERYGRAVGRALTIRAQGEFYAGNLAAVKALLAQAAPCLEDEGTPADRVYFESLAAQVLVRDGDVPGGLARIRGLEDAANQLGACPVQAVYFNRRTVCEDVANNISEVWRAAFRTLAIGEAIGEPLVRANALSNLGSAFHDAGNYEDARDLLRDALRLVDEYEMADLAMAHSNMAQTLLELKEYDEAWEQIKPSLASKDESDDPDSYAFTQLIAAEILLGRGERDRSRALAEPMVEFTQRHRLSGEYVHARVLMAQYALDDGDIDAALAQVEDVDDSDIPTGYRIELREISAKVFAAAGQWERGYRTLVEHNLMFEEVRATARKMRYEARRIEVEVRGLRAERDAALQRLDEVERLRAELAELAIKDHLTGLGNRRHLGEYLGDLFAREGAQFCLAVIDLDLFKTINDTYGHATGDVVLKAIADHLRHNVRAGDMVFRYGGEEFCIVLHRVDALQAAHIVSNIAQSYAELVVEHEGHVMTGLTFSAGIAEYPNDGDSEKALFECADGAMYEVKRTTRNAVRICGEPRATISS